MNRTPIAHILILIAFLANTLGPLPNARADELLLPVPGSLMKAGPNFHPPLIQGIKIDTQDPFHLQFFMEDGQGSVRDEESMRGLRYFLTALTVPETDIWVNLSPHEKNRIVPAVLADTEMGVDLLGQDYLLKQLASSLLYPEGSEGKEFWQRVYARAMRELGTTDVPLNVVNKVWITPGEILVQEKGNTAIITRADLQVMVESDYLALKANRARPSSNYSDHQALMNDAYRKIVIPELTREVNQGAYFIRVRQIYHALILAYWYKHHFHQGALAASYVDLKKTAGISVEDENLYGKIYAMYLKAYKKGAFNYIREEADTSGVIIPRKYFSGGFDAAQIGNRFQDMPFDPASIASIEQGPMRTLDVRLDPAQTAQGYIVDRGKKESLSEMGNKGRNLEENADILKENIPPFEILSTRLYDDLLAGKVNIHEVAARVIRDERVARLLENGGSLAVRPSSAINMPGILPTAKKVTTVDQLERAIGEIYSSWLTHAVQAYLGTNDTGKMFDDLVKMNIYDSREAAKKAGPAIVIQQEIFGDLNERSGSGVFTSRNTSTGDFLLSGSFGIKTAPEDIRNGAEGNSVRPISRQFPSFQTGSGESFYDVLSNMADKLERHYGYPVEVEFIVENGKLYVVQVNQQDIPASVRWAVASKIADEGKGSRTKIIETLNRDSIGFIGKVNPDAHVETAAQGSGLSLGAVDGYLAYDLSKARELRKEGKKVIFVSTIVNDPRLLQALVTNSIDGLVTTYGDFHMHIARIAREGNIPAISLKNLGASKEGDRVVINMIEKNDPQGNGIDHIGQLMIPKQEGSVVENTEQVAVGNLYFNVRQLQNQIIKKYENEDYTVLTATHALLKAFLQRNVIKGLEANKLEAATNAIHMILSKKFEERERGGAREDVYMPIAHGFGEKFPFPEIQTTADIDKAVEEMRALVSRYNNADMSPERVAYLNYSHTDPIMIPVNGDVPLEFSIIFPQGEVNWQEQNPQLWAFVRGIEIAITPTERNKGYVIPAELVADPVSPDKIRVLGKLSAQRLPGEVEEIGDAKVKIGLTKNASSKGIFMGLGSDYNVQIRDFGEYLAHKISHITEKDPPLLNENEAVPAANYFISSNYSPQNELADILNNKEKAKLENGGFLWRPLKLTGSHIGEGNPPNLNPSKFWASESNFLVRVIRQLFPDINVIHQEKEEHVAPSTMQGHNMPTFYQDTYASYVIFDQDAVEKLNAAISALAQKYDLSGMLIRNEREEKLDLEGVLLRLYLERFGKDELERISADNSQVGGIDLNLSGRKIGSDTDGEVFSPWTMGALDHIKGLIPVIIRQKSISSVMEFVGS